MSLRVDVPGKVVLAGEYSVLLPGEPCLVAAVERRLTVEAMPGERWSAQSGEARWREGEPSPEALRFVVGAIEAVRARWSVGPRALRTSDELRAGEAKLGLGGSAAATVAAVFAAAHGSGASTDELWAVADEVHRAMQGGKGSGADVAASVHGGVSRYWRQPREAWPVKVHPEVRLLLGWTGASVKTSPRLERWHAVGREEPKFVETFAARSREAVAVLEQGLVRGDVEAIRGGTAAARGALRGLEAAMQVELETPALRAAADAAWRVGAAGKLSGSGGGDCAVVICVGEEMRARAAAALAEAGVEPIAVEIADEGVRIRSESR